MYILYIIIIYNLNACSVNIIGEHVDYCGYSVLPMAVEQSIILAVGTNTQLTKLKLRHLDEGKFQSFDCDLNALE